MIRSVQQGLLDEGIVMLVTKLCAWFDVPRRTVYYKPKKAAPKLDDKFVQPIKALIEEEPSFGYSLSWLKCSGAGDTSSSSLSIMVS